MPPYVSIIILTKNGQDTLERVLKAVFNSRVDFEYEVIAIDSGSTDNTKKILSGYPVKLIEIPPFSFSHSGTRNLGAQRASGSILVFLTQDAIPADERWLSNLIEDFKIPEVAGIFGRQLPYEDSFAIERFFLFYVYPDFKIIKDSLDPNNCLLKDVFFSNVNSAILKSEWEEHRFDENLIMSEDQEWSKAMLLRGKKIVYQPGAAVFHSHKYSILELIRRNFDSGMSLKKIVNAPLRRSIGYEAGYLSEGIRFFIKNRFYRYLIIFPFYELARLFSFCLGFIGCFFKKSHI